MYYCPYCGRQTETSNGTCPYCGADLNSGTIDGDAVETESRIIGNEGKENNYSENKNTGSSIYYGFDSSSDSDNIFKDINGWIKLLLVICCFANVFLGFVISIILITRPYPLYKSFGIKLLLLCILLLILEIIFGALNLFIGLIFAGLHQITG